MQTRVGVRWRKREGGGRGGKGKGEGAWGVGVGWGWDEAVLCNKEFDRAGLGLWFLGGRR